MLYGNLAAQLRLCTFLALPASEDEAAKQIVSKEALVSVMRESSFL